VWRSKAAGLRLFNIGARITPHVRHRDKYVDVPVADTKAFFFSPTLRAHALRQFVSGLSTQPESALDGFLTRSDFSRWIAGVFGDQALAADLRALEQRYDAGQRDDAATELVEAVRTRYHLADEP
jgi:hypothetical protein